MEEVTLHSRVANLLSGEIYANFSAFKVGLPLDGDYCNMPCASHCYVGDGSRQQLSTSETVSRFQKLTELMHISSLSRKSEKERPNFILVGTEPTLEPKFLDVVDMALRYDLMVTVATNGWYFGADKSFKAPFGSYSNGKAALEDILESGRYFGVVLSLDGVKETHDQFRGVPGAYDRVIRTLQYAKELRIPTGIQTTIHPGNQGELSQIAEIAGENGAQLVKYRPLLRLGHGASTRAFTEPERESIQSSLFQVYALAVGTDLRIDAGDFEKSFPVFNVEKLREEDLSYGPRFLYLSNSTWNLSTAGYAEMPPIGNVLGRDVIDVMADLSNSWEYRFARDRKQKGMDWAKSLIASDALKKEPFNTVAEPHLILLHTYKWLVETGDLVVANQKVESIFKLS